MRFTRFVAIAAVVTLGGCAAAGLTPTTPTQPVARASLRPEYRVFYDALRDYGDWVLIEPYGFLFRPRVAWDQWQPFVDGFWAPSDSYGWIWLSAEPFGWATYHYGEWFWDRFQGWVWKPGLDWSPGWATWEIAGDYVGWGPMSVRTSTSDAPPTGAMHYVPLAQLGATDLRDHLVPTDQLGAALRDARPVRNMIQRDGVTFNRGPAFGLVEERSGPLTKVRVENLAPSDPGKSETSIETTRRAAEDAAAEARRWSLAPNAAPSRLPVVRPNFGPRPEAATEPARRAKPPRRASPTPADTTR